jgi:hypothetical protein
LIFFSLFSFILAWTFVSLQIKEFRVMDLFCSYFWIICISLGSFLENRIVLSLL